MLIDSSHRGWIAATILALVLTAGLYWWVNANAFEPLTGGTTAGLWFGVAGTLLMVFAGLLSLHRRLARWPWLPRRSWMLKGHIWLGLLSFWLILCHSGFHWGGTLERVLWVVFGTVVISGVVGLVLQKVLPHLMTERITEETPYEQMPYRCQQLTRRAVQVAETVCGPRVDASQPATARSQLRDYFDGEIAPFLAGTAPPSLMLFNAARVRERFAQFLALPELADERSKVTELKELYDQRLQIAVQQRLHHWLHAWLLIHIPLSMALLVLGAAHIVMSLYY